MQQDRRAYFRVPGWVRALLLIGVADLLLGGCAGVLPQPEPYPAVDKGMIAGEIGRLEQTLAQATTSEEKARLLMRLVMLHSHPDNPAPDYKKALAYMEVYVGMRRSVDARYVAALLKQLDACAAKSAALGQENKKLKQRAADLEQENRDHENVIEKLKRLDIQLEKKRKNMR